MLIVQKYGGTSVGSLARIRSVAQRCLETAAQGHQLVVVVSAMSGETNRLIDLSNQLVAEVEGQAQNAEGSGPYVHAARVGDTGFNRELDQLVSTGEQVSSSLLSMAIQSLGGQSVSLLGFQIGVRTDGRHANARIRSIKTERIQSELDAGRIVVCAGFQGTDEFDNITTLGRGGSDTSAVALAAALKADVCEVLTDVDGVYTCDPRIVPSAHKLERISHEEMLELASVGAKILHIRSVQFAMNFAVPVHVRSSLHRNEGTWIVPEDREMEAVLVAGIALDRNEAKVTLINVPDVPGSVAAIFDALSKADIVVDMIIQNASRNGATDVTFTVPENQLGQATDILGSVSFVASGDVSVATNRAVCKISVVGAGMRTHAGVAAKAFAILAETGVNVQMVSTSEIKISVVVHEDEGEKAVRALHTAFGLDADAAKQG